MTVSVNLRPELEARLTARARSTGEPFEDLIQRILEHDGAEAAVDDSPRLSGQEKAEAFRSWAMSFPSSLPLLSLESTSRENIYQRD